jgi:hypothetical protein
MVIDLRKPIFLPEVFKWLKIYQLCDKKVHFASTRLKNIYKTFKKQLVAVAHRFGIQNAK